jgi:hypothetical protein
MKNTLLKNLIFFIFLLSSTSSFGIYIDQQPKDVNVKYCSQLIEVSFVTIAFDGVGTYQWQENNGLGFSNINNANDSILYVDVISTGQDETQYRCVVSSICDNSVSDTSEIAYLYVSDNPPPSSVFSLAQFEYVNSSLDLDYDSVTLEITCPEDGNFSLLTTGFFEDDALSHKFQVDYKDGNGFVDYNNYYSYFVSDLSPASADTTYWSTTFNYTESNILSLDGASLRFVSLGGCNYDIYEYSNELIIKVNRDLGADRFDMRLYHNGGYSTSDSISKILQNNSCETSSSPSLYHYDFSNCATEKIIVECNSNSCLYQLHLLDSDADGWNGNSISVEVNGVTVLNNITLSSGAIDSVSFNVLDGDEISTTWNASGSFPQETSYEIYDNNYTIVGFGSETSIGDGHENYDWEIRNINSSNWTSLEDDIIFTGGSQGYSVISATDETFYTANFFDGLIPSSPYYNFFDGTAEVRCIKQNGVVSSSDTLSVFYQINTNSSLISAYDNNPNQNYFDVDTVPICQNNLPYTFEIIPNTIEVVNSNSGLTEYVTPSKYEWNFDIDLFFNFLPYVSFTKTDSSFTIHSIDDISSLADIEFLKISINKIFVDGYCPMSYTGSDIILNTFNLNEELKIDSFYNYNLNETFCNGEFITLEPVFSTNSSDPDVYPSFNEYDSIFWMVDEGNGFQNIIIDQMNGPYFTNSPIMPDLSFRPLNIVFNASSDKDGNKYKALIKDFECGVQEEFYTPVFTLSVNNNTSIPTIQIIENGDHCVGSQLTLTANPSTYSGYKWWIDSLDGNGFIPIMNNNIFSGANSSQLIINITDNMSPMYHPEKWKFQCSVDSTMYCNNFSETYNLEVLRPIVTTNIKEVIIDNINLTHYPNPVENSLVISSSKEIVEICLYSIDGILLKTFNDNSKELQLDMSALSKGIYVLRVRTSEGEYKVLKVVKI